MASEEVYSNVSLLFFTSLWRITLATFTQKSSVWVVFPEYANLLQMSGSDLLGKRSPIFVGSMAVGNAGTREVLFWAASRRKIIRVEEIRQWLY